MGCDKKTYIDPPTLKKPVAVILLIVDILFPGVGTIIAGLLVWNPKNIVVGILQLLTAAILVGWIWSIWWGVELYKAATSRIDLPGEGQLGPDSLL